MSVSTIKPAGGGDYTVLSLWATAKKFNTGVEDAQCFAGNCGVLTIGDWAPSSSTIYADASAKHNGVDNGTTGLAFSPKISIGGGVAWIIQDFYLTRAIVYQPIMHGSVTLNVRRCMIVNATNTDAVLFKVLVRDDASAPISAEIWIRNTVLLMKTGSTATTFFQADGFSDTGTSFRNLFFVHVDNNSMYAETSPANGIVWSYSTGADVTEEIEASFFTTNTAIFGATACFSAPTSAGSGFRTLDAFDVNYDASSDGTADDFGGTANKVNQVASTWFTSLPSDLRLKSGSPGKDAGFTISDFSDDIIGQFRPQGSAWDVGAFEAPDTIAGGGGIILRHHRRY